MPNADAGEFGRALAKLRLARGYTQPQVVGRILTYYGDSGAYGRVERGDRHPNRDAAVAILVRGLLIREILEINRVLRLGGFEILAANEIALLGLSQTAAEPEVPVVPPVRSAEPWLDWLSASILTGSLVADGLIAATIPGHAAFALLSCGLYAALFVVSLFLESSFDPDRPHRARPASLTFALVSLTSTLALSADRLLVDAGNEFALLSSLAIFLLAGVLQFALLHEGLAESVIVAARFQTLTAQSAHLKNTSYFLLVVVLFWLPSFHCVTTLSRESRLGNIDWVHEVLTQDLMIGHGVLAVSVRSLFGLLAITFLIALYMGSHLLENLRPHARLNAFTRLFFARGLLYFLLCLVCVGWYAHSLNKFR